MFLKVYERYCYIKSKYHRKCYQLILKPSNNKMFKFAVVFALIALAAAAPSGDSHHDDTHADVTVLESDVRADGSTYHVELTNGVRAVSNSDDHGNVHGEYEWVSPEGQHVKVTYVADENGYQPSSDLLPTPPPIPAEILRSLEWNAAHHHEDDDSEYKKN